MKSGVWKATINKSELEHSEKGSSWKNHKYIAIKNGHYIYDTPSGSNKESKETSQAIKNVSNLTGMKKESVIKLKGLGDSKGYDSKEYSDYADILSEGDPDVKKKITSELQKDTKSKKSSSKGSVKSYLSKNGSRKVKDLPKRKG